MLPGQIGGAPSSARGFDSDAVVKAAVARQFFAQGYTFCIRYLSLGSQRPGDLSVTEAKAILNSGLALMPVQHTRKKDWHASIALGQKDGQHAVSNATQVGFPAGVNIWCDLEGVAAGTPAQSVIDYCTAWFNMVNAAAYVPGLYVGAGAILDAQQLYDLPFQHYWKSMSRVPDIPVRGYQLVQAGPSKTMNGIGTDEDTTHDDHKGGQAQWLRISVGGNERIS